MIVRCKCYVANAEGNEYGQRKVNLRLVYSQTPGTENHRFHSASPSGNLTREAYNLNDSGREKAREWIGKFVPGSFWYVDTCRLNEALSSEEYGSHLALVGIKRGVSLPVGDDGNIKVVLSPSLTTELEGYIEGVRINQQVYIANEDVFSQFQTLGDLYSVEFIPATKEG